jgi:hypothetical protein
VIATTEQCFCLHSMGSFLVNSSCAFLENNQRPQLRWDRLRVIDERWNTGVLTQCLTSRIQYRGRIDAPEPDVSDLTSVSCIDLSATAAISTFALSIVANLPSNVRSRIQRVGSATFFARANCNLSFQNIWIDRPQRSCFLHCTRCEFGIAIIRHQIEFQSIFATSFPKQVHSKSNRSLPLGVTAWGPLRPDPACKTVDPQVGTSSQTFQFFVKKNSEKGMS